MNEFSALIEFYKRARPGPAVDAAAGYLTSLVVAVLFVGLWLVRSNVDFADPKFFGEDFPIFWAQYFRDGAEAFFRPYAGYIHLVPRIAGFAAWLLPAVWAPAVFLAVYALALAGCAFVALRHSALLGGLVIAATLAAPNTGEVFASITYFQWIAAPFLAILFVAPTQQKRIDRALRLAALAVLGLTGPFAVFLALFALIEAAMLRTRAGNADARRRLVVDAVILAAAALQVLTYVLFNDKWTPDAEPHFLQPLADGIRQTFSVLAQGEFGEIGFGAVFLMATLAAAIALPAHRRKKLILAGFSAVVALAAIYRFRHDPEGLGLAEFGTRYFFVPIVCTLIILGLTMVASRRGLLLCLPAALLIAISYDYADWRGPKRADVDWRAQVTAMRADGWSMIFVNPFWRFVHFREGGRSSLWWNPVTVLPNDQGILGPLAFPPGARLVIEGAQSAGEACGVAIPVIWMGPQTTPAPEGVFSVRFTSTDSDGVTREQRYEFPVAELSNWETMDVGAAPPGPQKVRVEISLAASEDPGVGFPTFAEIPDPVWDARVHLPDGPVLKLEPVVARMRCAGDGPFGDLN